MALVGSPVFLLYINEFAQYNETDKALYSDDVVVMIVVHESEAKSRRTYIKKKTRTRLNTI